MMKDVNILKSNGVNVDASLELFGDIETYDDTLETFLNEVDSKLENIVKFKEIADMANYSILVHSLKSDAKYFGFEKLAELAYNHEMESKANNFYTVCDTFDELMSETKKVISIVQQYLGAEPIIEMIDINPVTEKDKSILIVDDSDVISSFINKIFKDEFNVILAHDGKQAIDLICELNDNKIVGMLLDLNMPHVNGFDVLEYLKKNNYFEKIPVSIITGVGNEDLINKAMEYSIIDVLRKPFNERDVKTVVEKTIYNEK